MEEVKYKFTAIGRNSTKEVFPQNGNTLAVTWEKDEERAFFSKKLKGKMLFTGTDFQWMYVFESSQYRCEPIILEIEKRCSEGFTPFFTARLILNNADWDLDQCTVSIEAESEDRYTCYNDGKDKEVNLIATVYPKQVVQLVQGTIETINCTGTILDPGDNKWCGEGSQFDGWVIKSYYETNYQQGDPMDPQDGTYAVTYVREVITSTTPLGAPWIEIGFQQYARQPALYGFRSFGGQYDYGYDYQVGGSIDNGMKLQDCLQNLINNACYPAELRSNFFGWGSVSSSDYNYVTNELSKVKNLILFQKSDVKRPSGSNNASVANTTLEKLLKDVCNIFNLKWDRDIFGNFIIEHVSYFQKGVGLNLVGRRDFRLREGMNKYSYDIDNMPRREIFRMADEKYTYGDFRGVPITYSNSCVGQGEKEDKEWIVESIMTDVSLVLNNPNSDSQVVSDDGFVLMACDENNNILSEANIIGGNTLNNTLAWSRLQVDYWRHQRVFNKFMMNNVQTDALSVIPTKKQVKLNIALCCGEVFDPEELMNTQMGEGAVAEANFNLYQEMLDVTLLYDADENLVTNNPPVAVNDEVETFTGLAIDIDVLANDIDDNGMINPGSLAVVYPGSNGTVSIIDGKIRYSPNPGFVGADILSYNVKDEWEAVSNNGTITITVKPGSPLPIANDDSYSTAKNVQLTIGSVLSNDTGDGTLSCIPETKATSQGGSVQIYASGSFVYTPPTDYLGSDTFDYTMKDSNDNQATGTVTITVFNPQTVYVRYSESGTQTNTQYFPCPVESGQEAVQAERTITTMTQLFEYFSDSAGTVPLNVDGYGLIIKMEQVRTGTTSGTFPYDFGATGFTDGATEVIVDFYQEGCPSLPGNNYHQEYNLLPSPNYTIL